MSQLLAEARDRARSAGREHADAIKAERRAIAAFGRDAISFTNVHQAIRRTAFTERDAEHAALLVVALERLLGNEASR